MFGLKPFASADKNNVSVLTKKSNNAFGKRNYFIIYTVLFAFMAFIVYMYFNASDKTIIRYMDPYPQHFTALEYYGRWLRTIAKTLLTEHRLDIPMWDFSIGMGSDVITTFNYYAIGDPLALLSFIVPVKYSPYLYVFLFYLRAYLSGAFFSLYCMERKHKNPMGILTGALTYCFCFYAVYAGSKHPFFINSMVYLPLIFIAVEKILAKKSPVYLAVMVCIAEVSNFYFFYILVLFTVLYVALRLLELYGFRIKLMLAPLMRIAASSVIGVLLGAVIFLPVVIRFLSDNRTGVEFDYSLLYSLKYYLYLPKAFLSFSVVEPWTVWGYSVISAFAITAFFINKKNSKFEKIFFVLAVCGFLTPVFGVVANGFSYPCNRWVFVFSFFVAYVISQNFNAVFSRNKVKSLVTALVPVVIFTAGFVLTGVKMQIAVWGYAGVLITAALIILYALFFERLRKYKKLFQICVVAMGLAVTVINANIYFNSTTVNWMSYEDVQDYIPTEIKAVRHQRKLNEDNEFSRYTGDELKLNASVRQNMNSTQYYWSLSSAVISDFQRSTRLNEILYQLYNGFDDIASFNTLSSVKYYYDYNNERSFIPYGFEKTEVKNVYENTNPLPLGYTYGGYILREDFDKLETSPEMQQALMQGLVVDKAVDGFERVDFKKDVSKLDYEVVCDDQVTYKDGCFTVTKNDSRVYLKIKGNENSETYLSFKGIAFEGTDLMELYGDNEDVDPKNLYNSEGFAALSEGKQKSYKAQSDVYKNKKMLEIPLSVCDSNGEDVSSKIMQYYVPSFNHYSGKHDFDVNMGYSEEGFTMLSISFPFIGKYSFEDISVYSQTMDIYDEAVIKLGEDVLEDVKVQGDYVSGTISVDESRLLCLSVPYSEGWTAYVDGEETELLKANLMHMALELSPGEHKIELKYETPYLRAGVLLSLIGFILLLGYGLGYKYYCRTDKRNSTKKSAGKGESK